MVVRGWLTLRDQKIRKAKMTAVWLTVVLASLGIAFGMVLGITAIMLIGGSTNFVPEWLIDLEWSVGQVAAIYITIAVVVLAVSFGMLFLGLKFRSFDSDYGLAKWLTVINVFLFFTLISVANIVFIRLYVHRSKMGTDAIIAEKMGAEISISGNSGGGVSKKQLDQIEQKIDRIEKKVESIEQKVGHAHDISSQPQLEIVEQAQLQAPEPEEDIPSKPQGFQKLAPIAKVEKITPTMPKLPPLEPTPLMSPPVQIESPEAQTGPPQPKPGHT